jgi:hypothetical protein
MNVELKGSKRMVWSNDVEVHFRRNLLVYCSVVLIGNFLQIPIENVLKKLLDIEPGTLDQHRIYLVQLILLSYLMHRHFFSASGRLLFSNLSAKSNELLRTRVRAYLAKLVAKCNAEQKPWPDGVQTTQESLLMDEQIKRSTQSTEPLHSGYKNFTLTIPNLHDDWTTNADVTVDTRATPTAPWKPGDPGPVNIGHAQIALPQPLRLPYRIASWLETVFLSSESTEYLSLLALTATTFGLYVYKGLQLAGYIST